MIDREKLSDNFHRINFERSKTASKYGIANTMNEEELKNAKALCSEVLEKIRVLTGNKPLIVTSGFRSKELNDKVGWSNKSQHTFGEAADIYSPYYTTRELLRLVTGAKNIKYDQVIDETDYDNILHISYKRNGENRRSSLIAKNVNGKRIYITAV
jgi:hypothetical protein